jgi:hypothetical protein
LAGRVWRSRCARIGRGRERAIRPGGRCRKNSDPGTLRSRGQSGGGRSPRALSLWHSIGRPRFRGLGAPRSHSARQASLRSHGGTVPAVTGWDVLSEVFSPGSAISCRRRLAGRGADTPAIRGSFRVGTVATGTAPAAGRPLALCYGSDLLPRRLRSVCRGVMRFHTAPFEEVDGLCQVRSLPATACPLRALLRGKPGLLAGWSRRDARSRSGPHSSNRNPLGNCVGRRVETSRGPDPARPRFLIGSCRSAPEFVFPPGTTPAGGAGDICLLRT